MQNIYYYCINEQIKINHNNNFKIKLIKKFFLTPFNIEYITLTLNVSTHGLSFHQQAFPLTQQLEQNSISCAILL